MANHLRTELVLDAMEAAFGQRRPSSVIQDSDQGYQYTSVAFGKRCGEAGLRPSMGSVGGICDIVMTNGFFSTLEAELPGRRNFTSQAEAWMGWFRYIEGWYSPVRLHSNLGYRSPHELRSRTGGRTDRIVARKPENRPLKRGNLDPTFALKPAL